MNILINEARIEKRIIELAREIDVDYYGKEIVLLGVLKGSVVFMSDLARKLKSKVKFEFIEVNFNEQNEAIVNKNIKKVIEGKDILIVEDIIDTGKTLTALKRYLEKQNPSSINIVTLLAKPSIKIEELNVKYIGFGIHDQYVLGYGLDQDGFYRNLPYIGYIE